MEGEPIERMSAIAVIYTHPDIEALPHVKQRAATGIPPHITLLYPWRTPPVGEASLAALRDAIRGFAAFPLTLEGIGSFPQGVVYATVAASEPLRDLMRSVASSFPDTPPYRGAFGASDPVPHLTLAGCEPEALAATTAKMATRLAGVLPLTFSVPSIAVLEQGEDEVWAVTATLPLGH